jgi:hypothetical protein
MDNKRKWHRKKSDWARAKAAEARDKAMTVPGAGAISPKTRRAAGPMVSLYFAEERRWLDVAQRLEAKGE